MGVSWRVNLKGKWAPNRGIEKDEIGQRVLGVMWWSGLGEMRRFGQWELDWGREG